ncbi:MAG: glycosyltransferase family 39 protein [Bacteroidota bacterium]|nr:glycosyltransferase family 39 protein [Bacteroidota bacterium]MDP3146229.1 glycosyltransferase family 39 protein [Bacteroidota bacterium]MDP3558144.1 glycosyltransferase family 39 protein [Bacteroidota bacterium]
MQKNQLPFFLIALSIIMGLTLPTIIQNGMFMDGMLYTCVSKNLANGIGSFWFPVFSKFGFGGLSTFHEHPPLVFAIQAVFFKIFGNGMYTERIYVIVTIAFTCLLIVAIWKQINKGQDELKISWLPLILWITIPVCFWSFSNNMHENTMGIFILLSVLFYLKSIDNINQSIRYLIFSGFFIFLSTFSKGIPGFFPIALPFIYWLVFKKLNIKQLVFQTFILVIIPVLIYAVLFSFPDARESLTNYFIKRVLHRIGENPTVESHFYILGRIVLELIIPFAIVIIVLLFSRKNFKVQKNKIALAIFFILIGFSGVLPLIVTKVQKGFYFIPSLPFFAIGFALLISEPVYLWSNKILNSKYKNALILFSMILFSSIIIFSGFNVGKKSRDADMIDDVNEFGNVIPEYSSVSISEHRWNDWPLQCYLIRYYNISIDPKNVTNEFRILDKDAPDSTIINYNKVNLKTKLFDLYKKNN